MPADPYPGTPAPNTLADATKLRAQLDALFIVPSARVYHSANQAASSGAATVLAFNSERHDNDTIHDTATNNSRLTCKTAGVYLVTGHVSIEALGDNTILGLAIRLGGATGIAQQEMHSYQLAGDPQELSIATVYKLAVNNYLELTVSHNHGSSRNVLAAPQISPEFAMNWISLG